MRIYLLSFVSMLGILCFADSSPVAPCLEQLAYHIDNEEVARVLHEAARPDEYDISQEDVYRAIQYAYTALDYIDQYVENDVAQRNHDRLAHDVSNVQRYCRGEKPIRELRPEQFNIENELFTEPEELGAATTTVNFTGPVTFPSDITVLGDIFNNNTNVSPFLALGGNVGRLGLARIDNPNASDLDIEVPSGNGYLLDTVSNVLTFIEWNGDTVTVANGDDTFIYVDANANIQTSTSAPNEFENILLGKARADGGTVTFLQQIPQLADLTATRLNESLQQSLGNVVGSGLIVRKNQNTNKALDVTSGTYSYGLLEYAPIGANPISSWAAFAGDELVTASQSEVDATQYYDTVTDSLQSIPAGEFARHAFYVVGDGADQQFLLVYGQFTDTLNNTKNKGVPPKPDSWTGNIVILASIIVDRDNDEIEEVIDERPLGSADPVGVTTGTIASHNDLTGRNLDNNHPQYLLISGTREMTGSLQMGGSNVLNVDTVSTENNQNLTLDPGSSHDLVINKSPSLNSHFIENYLCGGELSQR